MDVVWDWTCGSCGHTWRGKSVDGVCQECGIIGESKTPPAEDCNLSGPLEDGLFGDLYLEYM